MSFLNGLGLGSLGLGCPTFQNPQAMANISYLQSIPFPVCMHTNCPICKAETDKQVVEWNEKQKKIALKKQDYERRCIEYMKRFRRDN